MHQLMEEWRAYHTISGPGFPRREPREGAEPYRQGWLGESPRQSLAPRVWALAGANPHAVRAMPQCISAGVWQDEARLERHWPAGEHAWGNGQGGLTWEGRDWLTQGQASVGVTHPYGGEVGPWANGQAGVSCG
jgi:hypothetical protein